MAEPVLFNLNDSAIDFTLNDEAINFTLTAIVEPDINDYFRLLEDGDFRLLEDDSFRLLE